MTITEADEYRDLYARDRFAAVVRSKLQSTCFFSLSLMLLRSRSFRPSLKAEHNIF
jgi:hypothetical protein